MTFIKYFGIKPCSGQTKDLKLVFAASQTSKQHKGLRAKTG
jgi:hypothetical protein